MVVGSMSVATLFVREKTVADCHTRKASTLPRLTLLVVLWCCTLGICIIVLWTVCTLLPLPVCHAIADILFVLTLNYWCLPLPVLFAHSLHLQSLPSISSGRPCDLTVSCTVAQASHYSICQCQSESVNIDSILTPVNTHTFHCLSCSD